MADEVILLDSLPSSFGMRVRIALAEKGIKYEYKEENLMMDKSPLLLQMNPVHKMIPVLIHNGKPICESLIILQYIDEVWNDCSPLLPSDPYQRSQAKFWADFIDKKIYDCGKRILMSKAEVQEAGEKEMIECLKLLEGELGDKKYFGGESLGFLDIALVPYYSWFYSYETCGNFSIEAECQKLMSWIQRCMELKSVSKSLHDHHKVYDYVLQLRKSTGKRIIMGKIEEQEVAKKELIECLKTLEGELGDKLFFGDETIGFVDVALLPFYAWFYSYETSGNFSIEAECPKMVAWGKRCMERESISKSLPDPEKIYSFVSQLKQKLGI
ncbi:hypothetical protein F0562_002130 [Nyssa sinensis]|uniref:glutathione transferase n=1 Tax=Nyssa sinensis TaxID=561372 RepID=A0A5J5C660_9ASTE|nr:hypothetical protein F0562_002130 [Nyssa sinensis]